MVKVHRSPTKFTAHRAPSAVCTEPAFLVHIFFQSVCLRQSVNNLMAYLDTTRGTETEKTKLQWNWFNESNRS